MASNFKIYCHRNSDSLHLKLMGEFDGSSAHKLINTIKKYHDQTTRFFIHTCSLSSVHPFGLEVFQNNLSVKKLARHMTFTGEYGNRIAPNNSIANA